MNKFDALTSSNDLHDKVEALCDTQDAATTQIMTIAQLARFALDGDAQDVAGKVGHALDAIIRLAAEASVKLDAAMIELSDARIGHVAAREGATHGLSPFGHVTPL